MQGEKDDQGDMFFYGSLDSLVPEDDPYRRLDALLDLGWLRRETHHLYSTTGRPSVDPVVIAKLLLIAYLQGITSERELMRQVQVNLSYRRFLHYRLSEALPDHSALTRSRQRLGEDTIRKVFEYVLALCIDAGLVGGELQSVDSTFVQANASLASLRPRLVAAEAKTFTEKLFAADASEEAEQGDDDRPAKGGRKRDRRLNEAYVSKTDPDSGLYRRRGLKSHLGFLVHFAVDRSKQVITAVLATSAQERDAAQLMPLLAQVEQAGITVKAVAADRGYSSGEVYHALAQQAITAFIPQQRQAATGHFSHDRFVYDEENDRYLCPNSAWLRRVKGASGLRYRARWTDCRACSLREQCTSGHVRTLNISPHDAELQAARLLQSTPAAKRAARDRRICSERTFGEAKDYHGLRRAHSRGRANMTIQSLLTATSINLKRYLKAQTRAFPAAVGLRAQQVSCPLTTLTLRSVALNPRFA